MGARCRWARGVKPGFSRPRLDIEIGVVQVGVYKDPPDGKGHPRLLAEVSTSGQGMIAWGTEETMERAAAVRLDAELRRAEGRPAGTGGDPLA